MLSKPVCALAGALLIAVPALSTNTSRAADNVDTLRHELHALKQQLQEMQQLYQQKIKSRQARIESIETAPVLPSAEPAPPSGYELSDIFSAPGGAGGSPNMGASLAIWASVAFNSCSP